MVYNINEMVNQVSCKGWIIGLKKEKPPKKNKIYPNISSAIAIAPNWYEKQKESVSI